MNNYYSMEKFYLAELLLLLAEAVDKQEEQNDD